MLMNRILLVDDEPDLVWAIRHALDNEGFRVFTAHDGVEALSLVHEERPDIIVLDVMMPRMDGIQLCYYLRHNPLLASIPILFLTVRNAVEDRIKGLDGGGDDYLAKPFDLGELKARIRALLRRGRSTKDEAPVENQNIQLSIRDITLNLLSHEASVGTKEIQLTPAEFSLLRHFMSHTGQVFSSQQLLQQVWGYTPELAEPGLVRWHVMNLRIKIEPDPTHPIYIRTVPHHGYMFTKDTNT